jgi:RNA-splicing ligase RtcB
LEDPVDNKIKLVSDDENRPEEGLIAALQEISSIPEVELVVGMVDLHLKKRTENPSSIAVATREKILPKLSSVAQNCGMCLLRTNLSQSMFTSEALDVLFSRWMTDDERLMRHPEITDEEMRHFLSLGAPYAVSRYELPESFIKGMEYSGVVGEKSLLEWKDIRKLVPLSSIRRGRHGFGVVPAGNHFLEIQYIEEIIDRVVCEQFKLAEKGITVMMHSDGGLASDDIGNLYGNRSTVGGHIKFLYNMRKMLFHLKDAKSYENLRRKHKYYFGSEKFIAIDPETYEGKRYLRAKDLSMNAGYAARIVTMSRFKDTVEDIFREHEPEMDLLCDFSHNSINRERIGDRDLWLHRHNACRVTEGQLVFLPGFSNTSSYICIGGPGASDYLNTMDHGAGETIKRFMSKGLSRQLEFSTRVYNNESKNAQIEPHYSDEGIDKVVELLEREKIAMPVARIRPIAGYRYRWKGRLARLKERMS